MAFVHLKLSVWASQSDTHLAFHNVSKGGRYYRTKKHMREDLILPELLLDNLSDVPEDIFQWKWRFFLEKQKLWCEKKIQWKWNELGGKWQYFKCGGNHMGKGRQNAKFRIFYWKSRGETNSIWPSKSVMNHRHVFGDSFFKMLCKKTNLYYFKNQGKYDSSSKALKWVDISVVCATHKKRSETRYISKFCVAPLHKEECFERYHSPKHYKKPWCFLKILVHKGN
jgi:hypothetical protein